MILWKTGNIFDSECQALVNPINCEGVMGKGLALEFKNRYPDMFKEYKLACKRQSIRYGGDIWVWINHELFSETKIIINFATKEFWRNSSKLEWIERGLKNFIEKSSKLSLKNIAFPKLGCANGRLDWETQVKPLMIKYLEPLDIECEIYE